MTPSPPEPPPIAPTGGRWHAWRQDRVLAHVVPLLAFQVLQLLLMLGTRNPGLPWYERAPEQWVYPLQTLVCGALVLWWWPCYGWRAPAPRVVLIGMAAGLAGISLWILPCEVFHRLQMSEESTGWLRYLGVQPRLDGFDPADAPWPLAALALRFLRMVVVVAVIEEVFWRGFLMRWLVKPEGNCWRVPFGTHHWRALAGTVLAVTLVHQPADYAAAFLWGILLYTLAVRTKSLAACILAHAVANLVLGIYAARTGHYGFW